ncbi:hypothetical protein JOB18_027760, partial [Solea senegalensis]
VPSALFCIHSVRLRTDAVLIAQTCTNDADVIYSVMIHCFVIIEKRTRPLLVLHGGGESMNLHRRLNEWLHLSDNFSLRVLINSLGGQCCDSINGLHAEITNPTDPWLNVVWSKHSANLRFLYLPPVLRSFHGKVCNTKICDWESNRAPNLQLVSNSERSIKPRIHLMSTSVSHISYRGHHQLSENGGTCGQHETTKFSSGQSRSSVYFPLAPAQKEGVNIDDIKMNVQAQ